MKKDVIYVDIEDDITSIIGKVKDAKAAIVALVPPKRTGVLQSAVNLKLLQRAAKTADKKIVLITNDHSLTALAAGLRMPIAKNLETKPEIPTIAALEVDDNDIIKGEDLPVGELAKTAPAAGKMSVRRYDDGKTEEIIVPPTLTQKKQPAESLKDEEGDDLIAPTAAAGGVMAAAQKLKVPNFDKFRKKFFLIGGGAVLLIAFLVWALAFAPHATVTIAANADSESIRERITMDPKSSTDIDARRIQPEVQEIKKTAATDFAATGSKEIGDKAQGSVVFSNCEETNPVFIEAGTVLTSGGLSYVTQADVTVPKATGNLVSGCTAAGQSGPVAVSAQEIGSKYNVASGSQFRVQGRTSQFTAQANTAISGGSSQTVKVITQVDIDKAKEQLSKDNVAQVRRELEKKFDSDSVIISESFLVTPGEPKSEPAVDQPSEKGRLTLETTYTLVALPRDEVKTLLNEILTERINNKSEQQVYGTGDDKIKFDQFQRNENGIYTVRLNTTGYIGPNVNKEELSKELVGKNFGEIQAIVEAIPGVDKADIKLSPFWVTNAPSAEKIEIKFSITNED